MYVDGNGIMFILYTVELSVAYGCEHGYRIQNVKHLEAAETSIMIPLCGVMRKEDIRYLRLSKNCLWMPSL
jgi:hypothetical protein